MARAKTLRGITVEIGGDTSKLGKAIRDVDQDTRSLQRELRGVNTLLRYDPKNVELTRQKQEILTESVEKTSEKLNILKEAQSQVQEQFDKGEITAEQYRDFQREIEFTEQRLKSYKDQLGEVCEEHRTLEQRLDMAAEKFDNVGSKMTDAGKGMTKSVTAPIVAVGATAIASAAQVDDGYIEIRKSTGATGEVLEGLKDTFKSVFKDSSHSVDDVAGTLSNLHIMTGATGDGLEKLTETTLDYARINNEEASTSAETLGRLMNALDQDVDQLPFTMDKLTKASQMSGLGVNELAQYIIDAGPAFDEMGFDLDRSIGLFANFRKAGAEPREVLSSLNIVLNKMAKDGATNAEEAFNTLMDDIKAAPDILSATSIASEAFGARVGSKVAEDIRAGSFEVDEWVEALQSAEGTVSDTAAETESLGDKFTTMKNKLMVAIEPVGSVLIDALMRLIEAMTPIFELIVKVGEAFAALPGPVQDIIVWVVALIAAIGPMLVIGGKIVSGIGAAIGSLSSLIGFVQTTGAAIGALSAGALLPVIGTIAAVIAAIVAIIAVVKNWGAITEWLKLMWENLTNWFSETFAKLKDFAIEIFTKIGEGIKTIVKTMVDGVIAYYTFLFESAVSIFKALWEGLTKLATTIKDAVVGAFKAMGTGLLNAIKAVPQTVMRVFDRVKNAILNPLKGINLFNIGKDIIRGLIDGIGNMVGAVTGAVRNVASSVTGGFKKMLGIASPARVIRDQIGKMIPRGLAIGIEADTDEAITAVKDMNDAIMVASDPGHMNLMTGSDIVQPGAQPGGLGAMMAKLDRLVDVMASNLEALTDPRLQVVMDTGVVVGELKHEMDVALGREQMKKKRGRGQ